MRIKDTILNEYQIDIDQVNLPKLYKIDDPDISSKELEKILAATKKRWVQGANSPNDTVAARNKERLAQVDVYEEILRNPKYLRALFDYHKKGGSTEDNQASSTFAKEFFTTLKDVNKNISQSEYNFFMQYFREERKNEKAILEMLKKDFRAVALKPCSFEDEKNQETESTGQSKIEQTRFHKDSLCLLHKCEIHYAKLQKSAFLLKKYPELNQSFTNFLLLDDYDYTEFSMRIETAAQEVFDRRQNDSVNGSEYIPLSEFYNIWKDILKRKDVAGNFFAFKLLVEYSKFTPYLYIAEEVNTAFLQKLLGMGRNEYNFVELDDFLFQYFKPLADGNHYSFIIDKKLEGKLKKIEQNPNAVAEETQRRSAAAKRKKMIPLPLQVLRFFATWPIYLVQFLFECLRFVVVNTRDLIWIIAAFFTSLCAHLFNQVSVFTAVWELITNFRGSVAEVLSAVVGTADYNNFVFLLGCLLTIAEFMFKFALAPAVCTIFMKEMTEAMFRHFDFEGYHKTFRFIQEKIEQQLIRYYKKNGKRIYSRMIVPAILNILTAIVVIILIFVLISLFNLLGSPAVASVG